LWSSPGSLPPFLPQVLTATISDQTSVMLLAKYTNGPLKLYAGYEWIQFMPPSNPQTAFNDIAGDFICLGCAAFLASVLAMSIAAPVQAQSPTQGDYYAPGPTTVVHPTQGQLKLNEQGDYYVGDKMILNKRRAEALKKCTHNIAFESDRYVACMAKEGEAP
jgi:hypothetical protein